MTLEVRVGAEVAIPVRVKENGASFHLRGGKRDFVNERHPRRNAHHETVQLRNRFQWQLGEILSVLVTMKRAVDVRACVRDHLDLPDLELGSRRILRTRSLAGHPVADHWSR